ncbi:MAG: HAMP domain-containing protein, partial [Candidatus Electrothrix sp. AR3]|nr:HAMP domain-containing protein [Candidatus Electrothrix sp. AR3]
MFRLKIALFSVLISGSVLIIFGIVFLLVISSVQLDRLDREVLTLGESQLHVVHPREHWQNFDQSLRSIYGEQWQDLIVQVIGRNQELLYSSPHWPEQITTTSFPNFLEGTNSPAAGRSTVQQRHPPRAGLEHPPPPFRPHEPMELRSPSFQIIETDADAWRVGIMGNQRITILLGINMARFYEDTDRHRKAFFLSLPLALLLIAGGGWWLAHRALKPVTRITHVAEKITAQGLDQRMPDTGADAEFLRLIKVINAMLTRLENSFQQAVRFSADAAHELQTPLTILQGV